MTPGYVESFEGKPLRKIKPGDSLNLWSSKAAYEVQEEKQATTVAIGEDDGFSYGAPGKERKVIKEKSDWSLSGYVPVLDEEVIIKPEPRQLFNGPVKEEDYLPLGS